MRNATSRKDDRDRLAPVRLAFGLVHFAADRLDAAPVVLRGRNADERIALDQVTPNADVAANGTRVVDAEAAMRAPSD